MNVKVKKLNENAVIPKYSKPSDAGLDLVATEIQFISPKQIRILTGLAFEIPDGHVGMLYPRSSIVKTGLRLSNSTGIIDSNYRGEVMLVFDVVDWNQSHYKVGDRVGQLIILPYPKISLDETDVLSDTDRGSGGFGSSGN